MPPDESDSPSLEQTLAQYLGSSPATPPDLRKLLADRPEVAGQLQRLLDDHQRATSARGTEPTLPKAPDPRDVPTLPPAAVESPSDAGQPAGIAPTSGSQSSGRVNTMAAEGSQFGDYELLEEIARGGMGVVFRARQVSLDRQVALKMILSGQLAAEQDVARFYAEAESAAQLEHPGIVPVFEVGQHDGQHFYAMGFVEGTSLMDRIAQGPLACTEAAEIIRQVASAVEYAHQRGVIHRDLKPANVLLDKQGHVRVTDFGLAKRVDRDSQMTASGQVLGTPSYMPPEQAGGQLEKIGPASDVYALGAVLYAMLTGRPPFQASTPVETLMQVLERDPVPPRQLDPDVDRDLDTICTKCLQKESHQRYATAQEVVAEIERYQRGEPLSARPISPWELLSRWHTRLRDNKVVRVRSSGGIGRIPWVDIAVGPDTETGQARGVARGIVAIGDTAWGAFAYGDSARGIVALGKSSYGVLSVGVRTMGLVSVGAFGVGFVSLSALSVGLIVFGGVCAGWIAVGGIAFGGYAFGALPEGQHVVGIGRRDPEAVELFSSWVGHLFGGALGYALLTGVLLFGTAIAVLIALKPKSKQ